MTWSRRFEIRESVRGSLWLVPLLGAALGGLMGAGFLQADESIDLPSFWEYSAATASTLLAAIVGATAALTGFVITVTVLVVQTAIGTFSARYMRLWYRDRLLKLTLAVLVGTLTFALGLLRDIEDDSVPNLGVTLTGWLTAVGLLLFLFFFHRFIQRIRPVAVSELVAIAGKRAHDESVEALAAPEVRYEPPAGLGEPSLVVRARRPGSIQAVDVEGLGPLRASPRGTGRAATRGGRLRPPARRARAHLRHRPGSWGRRRSSSRALRARRRAHDPAGPCVRDQDPGGHRDPGALAGCE
jgi:uncharacterized membrane protein